ncbi:hypothetical protein BHE74_00049988 [Ensete ventricosum]|nr:hypothetical protein BHE74_00049988 [Ensete ventricosum]
MGTRLSTSALKRPTSLAPTLTPPLTFTTLMRVPPQAPSLVKLIDGFLQEIAKDENLPMEKLIAIAKVVSNFARLDHDDLYGVVDICLRVTDVEKGVPKVLIDRL